MAILKSLLINSFLICSSLALYGEMPKQTLEIFPALDQIYHPVSTNNLVHSKLFLGYF